MNTHILENIIEFRPPRMAILLLILAALLHTVIPSAWIYIFALPWLGIILGLSGFITMMRGWWLFKQYKTAICPTAANTRLVINDIYRYSRNPMYLGMLLMLAGTALLIGTLPFYISTVIFFFIMNHIFCPYEERKLLNTFGQAYADYKNKVRRWL